MLVTSGPIFQKFFVIDVSVDIASKMHDYFMIQSETSLISKRSSVTIENNKYGYKKLWILV